MEIKKLIRKGVFETNSSSCHSITIERSNGVYNSIPSVNDNGSLFINSGEFGWEEEDYCDFYSKASYLIVYIRDWTREDTKKEEYKNIFESVLKEVTGCEEVLYEDNFWKTETRMYEDNGETKSYEASLGDGYIDHQFVEGNDLDYLFEDIEEMKDFLFNSFSELHTDNDNY